MKTKWLLVLILCMFTCLLLCAYCNKNCDGIKRPKNLKSIDWEDYNDVYTVYWNYHYPCKERTRLQSNMSKTENGKYALDIKIYGWASRLDVDRYGNTSFMLYSKDYYKIPLDYPKIPLGYTDCEIIVGCRDTLVTMQMKALFDTVDLAKKCFVQGKLHLESRKMHCCDLIPEIVSINDIYFE